MLKYLENKYVPLNHQVSKEKKKHKNQSIKLNESKSRAYENLYDVGKAAL